MSPEIRDGIDGWREFIEVCPVCGMVFRGPMYGAVQTAADQHKNLAHRDPEGGKEFGDYSDAERTEKPDYRGD